MNLDQIVARKLAEMSAQPGFATQQGLNAALRLLAKWRSQLIDNTLIQHEGTVIKAGPFKGMHFVSKASEANVSPRLLGNYEAELHPLIEQIIADDFEFIVDIGCADGYYACGFAYRMPKVRIAAFDMNSKAQDLCRNLSAKNGVSGRVTIAGEFQGKDFALFADKRSLIFIDAEGAEDDLLQPDKFSALQKLHIVVECHDVFKPGLSTRIADRFATTHRVGRIEPQLHSVPLPSWLAQMGHLDQLLAIWEWRMGPTPWLVLTPH